MNNRQEKERTKTPRVHITSKNKHAMPSSE